MDSIDNPTTGTATDSMNPWDKDTHFHYLHFWSDRNFQMLPEIMASKHLVPPASMNTKHTEDAATDDYPNCIEQLIEFQE